MTTFTVNYTAGSKTLPYKTLNRAILWCFLHKIKFKKKSDFWINLRTLLWLSSKIHFNLNGIFLVKYNVK